MLVELSDRDVATITSALNAFAQKMRDYDYGPNLDNEVEYRLRQERLDAIATARAAVAKARLPQ